VAAAQAAAAPTVMAQAREGGLFWGLFSLPCPAAGHGGARINCLLTSDGVECCALLMLSAERLNVFPLTAPKTAFTVLHLCPVSCSPTRHIWVIVLAALALQVCTCFD
jgi:hypothetical protein